MTGDRCQRGFTYLALLLFLAILGVGLATTAISWQTVRQSEKERELLFIGTEFRDAIALYYNRSPGVIKEFPRDLKDLIKDQRYPNVQRYLRRIYRDPMTGLAQWGTVPAPGGGIMGVYSLSGEMPRKKAGFPPSQAEFGAASPAGDRAADRPAHKSPRDERGRHRVAETT